MKNTGPCVSRNVSRETYESTQKEIENRRGGQLQAGKHQTLIKSGLEWTGIDTNHPS